MYRGRIGTENWHLLKYFFNNLSQAAAVAPQSYKPFELIAPPIRIITLFWTKGKRSMLEAICGKIGARCHVSHVIAKHDFVPYIKEILQKHKSSLLIDWFGFTSEEVTFLIQMNRY
jgi:hypothetical protein